MEAINQEIPAVSKRNAGIDLLRVVAAFYVVLLHLLRPLMEATAEYSYQYFACEGLYSLAFCAVNIFGIISGYVGYTEDEKPQSKRSFRMLWLQVLFYNVVLTLATMCVYPGVVTTSDLIWTFFPILGHQYWYLTSYTALLLFLPLLNSAVRHCSRKTLLQFFTLILCVVSPIETVFHNFISNFGYSPFWLIILYLIGAIMKKTGIGSRVPPLASLGSILVLTGISFLIGRRLIEGSLLDIPLSTNMVYRYVFPCHILSAIFHVLLFSRLKLGKLAEKLIAFAAPGAFAVYILNMNRYIWKFYPTPPFVSWAGSSPLGVIARAVAFSALFVAVSLIADYCRRQLFRLLLV